MNTERIIEFLADHTKQGGLADRVAERGAKFGARIMPFLEKAEKLVNKLLILSLVFDGIALGYYLGTKW